MSASSSFPDGDSVPRAVMAAGLSKKLIINNKENRGKNTVLRLFDIRQLLLSSFQRFMGFFCFFFNLAMSD